MYKAGGHHVGGLGRSDKLGKPVLVHRLLRSIIGAQRFALSRSEGDDQNILYPFKALNESLDLSGFDAEAADLYLPVGPAHIFDQAVLHDPGQITCMVHLLIFRILRKGVIGKHLTGQIVMV